METLHKDLLSLIFNQLKYYDQLSLSLTCKYFKTLSPTKTWSNYCYELASKEITSHLLTHIDLSVVVRLSNIAWKWDYIRYRSDLPSFLNSYVHPNYVSHSCLSLFYFHILDFVKTKHLVLNRHVKFDSYILYRHGTMDMIDFNLCTKKDWLLLSTNVNVTILIIRKYIDKPWSWYQLSKNKGISYQDKMRNRDLKLSISSEDRTKQKYISSFSKTLDFKTCDIPLIYIQMYYPGFTMKDVFDNIDLKWDWYEIANHIRLTKQDLKMCIHRIEPYISYLFYNKYVTLDTILYIVKHYRCNKVFGFKKSSFDQHIEWILKALKAPELKTMSEKFTYILKEFHTIMRNDIKLCHLLLSYVLDDTPEYLCLENLDTILKIDPTLVVFKNMSYYMLVKHGK